MGCPGNAAGPSTGGERIGAVTWAAGYNYPRVVGGDFTISNYNTAYDGGNSSASGLEGGNDSCSCLCSGLYAGEIPFFYQFLRESTYTSHEDTWPTGSYFPGGSTGIYMASNSSRQYYFNIGQQNRCQKIYAGLYQLSPSRGTYRNPSGPWSAPCGTGTWAAAGRLDVTFEIYLFGSLPTNIEYKSPAFCGWQLSSNQGGFPWISLCISPLSLGSDNSDGCPLSSCLNSMDYGTAIPSTPIPSGHNLLPGCPPSSTVWQTCQDSNCSPNGVCLGPPSNPSPTGCISNNSILNGFDVTGTATAPDNGCFDCEGRPIHHPCYGTKLVDPSTGTVVGGNLVGGLDVADTWNGAPSVWESPLGMNTTAVYGGYGYGVSFVYAGCETMGMGEDTELLLRIAGDPRKVPVAERRHYQSLPLIGGFHYVGEENTCSFGTQSGVSDSRNRDDIKAFFADNSRYFSKIHPMPTRKDLPEGTSDAFIETLKGVMRNRTITI